MQAAIEALPDTVVAPRTDPVYNCHAYLTKVPIAAIQPFIDAFSKAGETVVDLFAGSGMTGLAARSRGRNAILSDISVLGQHIGRGYLTEAPPGELRLAAKKVMAAARGAMGELYRTIRISDGADVELVRTVWSFTYLCPQCESPLVFFDEVAGGGPTPKECPTCHGPFERRRWQRGADVPVEVVVDDARGRQCTQPVQNVDQDRIKQAQADSRLAHVPSLTIDQQREMYSRSGLGKAGMTKTADFFSPRNAIALLELWKAIEGIEAKDLRQKLQFAFTAILARASKRYQWSAKRPLNAQNQTYYIAPVYYEWNVFELFERKVEASIRANEELTRNAEPLFGASANVQYELASAATLSHLADVSVDYIFTDPPFGSNIFYSDMSLFHEAWLGRTTDSSTEAVVHTTGTRKAGAADRYEALLRGAFSEAFRVLKPGRYMSVVFGNSNGKVWGLVQRALRDAGFRDAPVHVAILDKGQRSVKGLNSGSEGVVTVDLVLTVRKPESAPSTMITNAKPASTIGLIQHVIGSIAPGTARNPSHVYALVLKEAIRQHLTLDDLHLSDVLLALSGAGYAIDKKTGLLTWEATKPQEAA